MHKRFQFNCRSPSVGCASDLRPCHILPDSANGRVTDSKILCPFVSVRVRSHAFLVRSSCGECFPCQAMSVLSGPIRWQVLNMFKTSNGRHRIKMSGGWTLLVRLYAVCLVLVRSASCRYPVCIRWCPFDLTCERSTTGHVTVKTEFPGRVPHVKRTSSWQGTHKTF